MEGFLTVCLVSVFPPINGSGLDCFASALWHGFAVQIMPDANRLIQLSLFRGWREPFLSLSVARAEKMEGSFKPFVPNDWRRTENPEFLSSLAISFTFPSRSAVILSSLLIAISRAFPHAAQIFTIMALSLAPMLA
jgi:hypothetical protein